MTGKVRILEAYHNKFRIQLYSKPPEKEQERSLATSDDDQYAVQGNIKGNSRTFYRRPIQNVYFLHREYFLGEAMMQTCAISHVMQIHDHGHRYAQGKCLILFKEDLVGTKSNINFRKFEVRVQIYTMER